MRTFVFAWSNFLTSCDKHHSGVPIIPSFVRDNDDLGFLIQVQYILEKNTPWLFISKMFSAYWCITLSLILLPLFSTSENSTSVSINTRVSEITRIALPWHLFWKFLIIILFYNVIFCPVLRYQLHNELIRSDLRWSGFFCSILVSNIQQYRLQSTRIQPEYILINVKIFITFPRIANVYFSGNSTLLIGYISFFIYLT